MSSKSPWPKKGLAGKIHAARTHKPESVEKHDIQILSVGYVAWAQDRDVTDVWREVTNDDLARWSK
jgi:hypothetical protein